MTRLATLCTFFRLVLRMSIAAAAEMHGSGAINLRAFRNQQINSNLNLGSYQIVNSKFPAL